MLGFTYNGIHSSDFNIYYTPSATDRGDFYADYEIKSEEYGWQAGGEFYKARVKSRSFSVSCFYELVTYKQREQIIRWLDRRTSGELIFDDRPYATYFVRPTKKIVFSDYHQLGPNSDVYSGTFTIEFTAFYPFASLNVDSLDDVDTNHAADDTSLVLKSQMPTPIDKDSTSGIVLNQGTEVGHSIIRFSGKTGSSDLKIKCDNGTVCTIKAGCFTDPDAWYEIHSKNGNFVLCTDTTSRTDFTFHDDGYITFEPADIIRDVYISTTAGSKEITSPSGYFTKDMIGKYAYLDGTWKYIGKVVDASIAEVNVPCLTTDTVESMIGHMNFITIEKGNDAIINKLEIVCKPEVR